MVEEALRGVVRMTLIKIAKQGLPVNHQLYITFMTNHPGVVIADHLYENYPRDMTIVLQYQFWGLEIESDAFSVSLSFDDVRENLYIPFKAITGFADPSVNFALQFLNDPKNNESETYAAPTSTRLVTESNSGIEKNYEIKLATAAEPAAQPDLESVDDNVVTLDKFRKK